MGYVYLFFILLLTNFSLLFVGATLQANIRLIAELNAADLFFTSRSSVGGVGSTSLFNLLYMLPIAATAIGSGIERLCNHRTVFLRLRDFERVLCLEQHREKSDAPGR